MSEQSTDARKDEQLGRMLYELTVFARHRNEAMAFPEWSELFPRSKTSYQEIALRFRESLKKSEGGCEWKWDTEFGCFSTTCGSDSYVTSILPSDLKWKFCPFCGKPITQTT